MNLPIKSHVRTLHDLCREHLVAGPLPRHLSVFLVRFCFSASLLLLWQVLAMRI